MDSFVLRGLFSTLTNVNFSHSAFYDYVNQSQELARSMRSRVLKATDDTSWFDSVRVQCMDSSACMPAVAQAAT